jgi:hypothetical protein
MFFHERKTKFAKENRIIKNLKLDFFPYVNYQIFMTFLCVCV